MLVIQFAVWPHKKHLFTSYKQVEPMQKIICEELKRRFPDLFSKSLKCGVGMDEKNFRFQFQFLSLCTGQDDLTAALTREVVFMTAKLGLQPFFQIGILTNSEDSTHQLTMNGICNLDAVNSKLLDDYQVDSFSIPEEFLCSISKIIMDYPVYIKGGNDRFDLNSLRKWYISQNKLFDPVRQVYFDSNDIIHDGALHARISEYIGKAIQESLQQQAESQLAQTESAENNTRKLKELIAKHQLLDGSTANREKALRIASAEGGLDDVKFLCSLMVNIDAKDNNPLNGKTALHWAVIKGREDCILFLTQNGARRDIQDAKGKTAEQYAENNDEIKLIFKHLGNLEALRFGTEDAFCRSTFDTNPKR